MKFRIHFEIGEYQDYIDIEGETTEEILKKYETYVAHGETPIFLKENACK